MNNSNQNAVQCPVTFPEDKNTDYLQDLSKLSVGVKQGAGERQKAEMQQGIRGRQMAEQQPYRMQQAAWQQPYGMQQAAWQQSFTNRQMQDIEQKIAESAIRIKEKQVNEEFSEQKKLEAYARRLQIKEEARERERAIVEVLSVNEEGELLLQTKNASVVAIPRMVTNMTKPNMIKFIHINNEEDFCYKLNFNIGEKVKNLFFDTERIGKANYLIKKFAAVGVYFEIPPRKVNALLIQLMATLCAKCEEEKLVADTPGWAKSYEGDLIFFSEEEMTWEQIKRLCR